MRTANDLRRRVETWLDDDTMASPLGRLVSHVTSPLVSARARKVLTVPDGRAAYVGVGGVLLGGSGKTPVSIAVARALARAGTRVALVGHGYGTKAPATARACRVVRSDSPTSEVGDEARVAARQLDDLADLRVVVGPRRALAVVFATHLADVVVVDGAPFVRAAGSGGRSLSVMACPRPRSADEARRFESLVRGADLVVHEDAEAARVSLVDAQGTMKPLAALEGVRFGLGTAIARPSRAAQALGAFAPHATLTLENHGRLTHEDHRRAESLTRREALDLWVVTEKGPWLDLPSFGGRPLHFLRQEVDLPHDIVARLVGLARPSLEGPPQSR